jgi:hypothetical protein
MAYTAWSVVFGEQPSASKWNILGTNDAGFKDGTNIDSSAITTAKIADEAVTPAKILNRTREVPMLFLADGSGGAVSSITLGMPAVQFSGTPSGFLRANGIIPVDYVSGTDITIRLKCYASSSGTHTHRRYVNADASGDSLASLWDIDSAVSVAGVSFTANILREIDITVASTHLIAGNLLSLAWQITTAITGNLWVEMVSIRYTADS